MEYLINGIRGFCMAIADSMPGVSGGTIAFILGFYDKFINSLDDLIYGDKEKKKKALFFLIKLGIGWVLGFILAVLVLTSLFENHIYKVSSVFMGFIVFSIPLIIKKEKDSIKGKYKNIIFAILGIAAVALITYFNPMAGEENAIDLTNLNLGLGIYIFASAMIAISAMVLPGISGSTILLIFGIYMPIVTAIKDLLHLDFSVLPVLFIFGFGMIAGVLIVIKLIKIALEKFRSQTIYFIVGLMIGSLYAIVMGPTTLSEPQAPVSLQTFSILFFIIGAAIILGLEKVKDVLESRNEKTKENKTDQAV